MAEAVKLAQGRIRARIGSARRAVVRATGRILSPIALGAEAAQMLRTRSAIRAFSQRSVLAHRFPERHWVRERPAVLAVVTHVATAERSEDETLERLTQTLDSLLASLAHTELDIILNTIPERHFASRLPEHLRSRIVVREHDVIEPMLLGFKAQEEFVARADRADWFLYLEDDIILSDSLLLEKLSYFYEGAPTNALLLPHRYEFWLGRRTYIDLVSKASPEICAWNRLTVVEIGGWKFAEFENPHSGFYALSRSQLAYWLATGRKWYGKISFMAARESAATGCLGEAFRLYKPHPANMNFLEVRHLDTKYSEQHIERHRLIVDQT